MAAEDVKLIGLWASPFVVRVRIALNLKGIKYEFLQEEHGKRSELLLKSNPVYKKFPVLIHGGKPVCESLLIVQYIDEVWPSAGAPILPADSYDRAICRFWAAYIDDKLPPQGPLLLDSTNEKSKAEAKDKVFAALQELEMALVNCSKGKSFFGGDSIGYIDIALGSLLGWLKASKIMAGIHFLDETKTPRLVEWAERFCSAMAVKEVLPEAEKLAEFRMSVKAAGRVTAAPADATSK